MSNSNIKGLTNFTWAVIALVNIYCLEECASFTIPTHVRTQLIRNPNVRTSIRRLNSAPTNIDTNSLIEQYPDDYLITDSTYLPDESRPSILAALSNPRDIVALPSILVGIIISFYNIFGTYNESYQHLEILAIGLGFLSTIAYLVELLLGYNISPNIRCGIVDDAAVTVYAAMYTGAVSWLALRTCDLSPVWLQQWDGILPIVSVGVFAYSLLAPYLTLFTARDGIGSKAIVSISRNERVGDESMPELSPTELLRARGLLAIGCLGCVFAPDALTFALEGQEWWDRVHDLHPSQRYLESSTALFALFSVEASMISHRVGKTGAACYKDIVPTFGLLCLVLTIVPCVCALHWLGNDISFFSFYNE
jgi:hypothetical protein